MKNKSKLFLVIGFCVVLITPQIFLLKKVSVEADENKEEIEFPKFVFPHIERFTVDFDKFHEKKFGGKNELIELHNYIQHSLLKSSPLPNSVVLGKDEWLFLGNKYNNVLYKNIGLETFSSNDLETIWGNIQQRKEYLNHREIKYYLCTAPNKHTVYNDYLPSHFQNKGTTQLEQLKIYLEAKEFELIDLKDNFNQYDSLRLFHKTNTHWNALGAFLGYKRLISSIQADFVNLQSFELNDFKIDTLIRQREDLTKMIKTDLEEEHIVLQPIEKFQSIVLEKKLAVPMDYYGPHKNYENRYKGIGNLKVLVFRDSFSTEMIQFMKEYFGEIVFIWHHDFNKEIIENEKPDIVIHEIIERDIDKLKK